MNSRDGACTVSTTTEYNNHYTQLLIAELLYKNDYEQTLEKRTKSLSNRTETHIFAAS